MENLLIDNMLENAKIGIWVIELSHKMCIRDRNRCNRNFTYNDDDV